MDYITLNESFTAIVPIPESQSTDTVTYKIYKGSDGSEFATGNMTYVVGIQWKVAFTPTTLDVYILEITDTTLDIKIAQVYQAIGAEVTPPTAPSAGDLTSLANLKAFLSITDTDSDTLLTRLITQVSKFIVNYCNRTFEATDYTEYHSGDGKSNELVLKQYPVISITSVHDDTDREYNADDLIDSDDYTYDSEMGIITLDDNLTFSKGNQNVKIVYNAGYSTIPADLELVCMRLCGKIFVEGQTAIETPDMLNIALRTLSFEKSDIKRALDQYKKIRW